MFSSVFDLAKIVSRMLDENCHNSDVANKNIKVFSHILIRFLKYHNLLLIDTKACTCHAIELTNRKDMKGPCLLRNCASETFESLLLSITG